MTRTMRALLIPALLLSLTSGTELWAQRSTQAPKAGDMAVTGNLGFANAFDNDFDGLEPVFTGSFEYYTTPRISWRGELGFTSFEADFPPRPDIDVTFVTANVLYNWERGWVHPFVTGGLGLYSKDASPPLPSSFDDTEIGLNFGGGLDWYIERQFAIKFEGTFHGLTGEEPDTFFLGTAGVKWWF